jgi:hypothetical protein
MFFKVYTNKTAHNAVDFLDPCKTYFPFYISHVLTDNGAEFTDRFTHRKTNPVEIIRLIWPVLTATLITG